MNENEPVRSIGAVFLSLKAAVIAVITVIAVSAHWDDVLTGAVIGAGAAITVAIGDIIVMVLTREKVTPVANPNLPIDTIVNRDIAAPTGVVTAVQP